MRFRTAITALVATSIGFSDHVHALTTMQQAGMRVIYSYSGLVRRRLFPYHKYDPDLTSSNSRSHHRSLCWTISAMATLPE